MDGLVSQLPVNPFDEFGELGVPGESFLLCPVVFPFEAGIMAEVARPFTVRPINPVVGPCDASGSNLTGSEVVKVGIGCFDGLGQS